MDTISNAQTVIKLLWTGGWDSTYRLVELSRMDVTVQPIYGCDGKRDSMEIEKQTLEKIRPANSVKAAQKRINNNYNGKYKHFG